MFLMINWMIIISMVRVISAITTTTTTTTVVVVIQSTDPIIHMKTPMIIKLMKNWHLKCWKI